MLCKRCVTVMGAGTTYERRKGDNNPLVRRFYECKKCRDRVYTKEPNFQECINDALVKNKNR